MQGAHGAPRASTRSSTRCAACASLISSAPRTPMVGPQEYGALSWRADSQEKAALLYAPYEQALREPTRWTSTTCCSSRIRSSSSTRTCSRKYQEKWRFVHIDEYQDTNKAQYLVARISPRAHHNLCVVGDDAQSIYAFRGADIGNILSFQRDYPTATTVRLEQNYRSTGRILRLAQSIIAHNKEQLKKDLRTDNREGDFVYVVEAPSDRDEATKVERTHPRPDDARGAAATSEFAVLYRTNAQSARSRRALRRAGDAVPSGRRRVVLRAQGDQGRARLPAPARQPQRRGEPAPRHQLPARGIGDTTRRPHHRLRRRARPLALAGARKGRTREAGLAGRAGTAVEKFRFLDRPGHATMLASQDADERRAERCSRARGCSPSSAPRTRPRRRRAPRTSRSSLNALAEHVQAGEGRSLATFLQDVTPPHRRRRRRRPSATTR